MADRSKIEWCDSTWNPIVGCTRVSPGCDNCYAIRGTRRLQHLDNHKGLLTVDGKDWSGEVRLIRERLGQPSRWRRPRRIFVCSMSDLFHPDISNQAIVDIFTMMACARQHQFQILTKRPQRMARLLADSKFDHETYYAIAERIYEGQAGAIEALYEDEGFPNVWLGVSIENDEYAFRAGHLRNAPAAVRFLSLEPLLGPVPSLDLSGIDWVIVGGESGPAARPMHPDWVRTIRDRCVAADVPFLFKGWGEWQDGSTKSGNDSIVTDDGSVWPCYGIEEAIKEAGLHPDGFQRLRPTMMARVGKKAAGRVLDGRTWDQYPEEGR